MECHEQQEYGGIVEASSIEKLLKGDQRGAGCSTLDGRTEENLLLTSVTAGCLGL